MFAKLQKIGDNTKKIIKIMRFFISFFVLLQPENKIIYLFRIK